MYFKITVTNDGERPATGLTISDTFGSAGITLPYGTSNSTTSCSANPNGTLAAGATFECRYRSTAMTTGGDFDNTVTATSPSDVTSPASDTASVHVRMPHLVVHKYVSTSSSSLSNTSFGSTAQTVTVSPGSSSYVYFQVLVTNDGDYQTSGMTITDTWKGSAYTLPYGSNSSSANCDSNPNGALAAGVTFDCRYRVAVGTTVGDYDNSITAAATPGGTAIDSVAVAVGKPAHLVVHKYVSTSSSLPSSGSFGTSQTATVTKGAQVYFKVTVTNDGDKPATGFSLTDTFDGTAYSLPFGTTNATTACPTLPASLAAGTTYECRYRSAALNSSGTFNNIATTSSPDDATSPASDSASVTVRAAHLTVTQYASVYQLGSDGDGVPDFGTATSVTVASSSTGSSPWTSNAGVWFSVTITNDGDATASSLTISDTWKGSSYSLPYNTNGSTSTCDSQPSSLAVGASFTCLYRVSTGTSTGTFNNVISASSPNDPAGAQTATAAVTVGSACSGTSAMVPLLVGLSKTSAQSAWTAVGFSSGNMTSWSSSTSTIVVTQSVQAYSCAVKTSAIITITRTDTQ